MCKDKMTALERAIALSKGQEIDRIQCNPNLSNGIARISGCKISEFNHSSKALADAVIATYNRFGGDGAKIFTDLFILSEAMGAKMKYPEDGTVDLLEPAINKVEDIENLNIVNPYKDGRLAIQIEAMKIVKDRIGKEVPVSTLIVGPFTSAFFLIGVKEMTRLMIKNPDAVHKLCKISLESCLRFTEEAIKQGVGVTIAEPMSSCTVISPKHFREYAYPYIKTFSKFIKEKCGGVSIHICGQTEDIWEDLADMWMDGVSIDNVASLKNCVNKIGNRMKVMGNIDPSSIMYSGSREDVRKAVLNSIKIAHKNPKGYMVMPGCGLPVETPVENIDAMMNAAREVGWPIDEEKIDYLLSIDKY